MASTYTWTAAGSGAWGDAVNWSDVTNPGAGASPGATDTASIAGPSYPAVAFDVIYGPAAAATLTTSGNIAFAGAAAFGAWTRPGTTMSMCCPARPSRWRPPRSRRSPRSPAPAPRWRSPGR